MDHLQGPGGRDGLLPDFQSSLCLSWARLEQTQPPASVYRIPRVAVSVFPFETHSRPERQGLVAVDPIGTPRWGRGRGRGMGDLGAKKSHPGFQRSNPWGTGPGVVGAHFIHSANTDGGIALRHCAYCGVEETRWQCFFVNTSRY